MLKKTTMKQFMTIYIPEKNSNLTLNLMFNRIDFPYATP